MKILQRATMLGAVGFVLMAAFAAQASAQCTYCDPTEGCQVWMQSGHNACTDHGGGSCTLSGGPCGGISLLREVSIDGQRLALAVEVRNATNAWRDLGLPVKDHLRLTATLSGDGVEELRDCSGAILSRRFSTGIASTVPAGETIVI